jgi:hypothetical protein
MKDLIEKTQELISIMEKQLHDRFEHTIHSDHYTFEEGRNYIKLIRRSGDRSSVAGFIVKKSPKTKIDNKTNSPFQIGDMLMAAGYNKPATNFARGNIFNYNKEDVRWTGIL